MKSIISLIIIAMNLNFESCDSASNEDALEFLRETQILEEFYSAIEPFNPEKIEADDSSNLLLNYKKEYSRTALDNRLIKIVESTYSETELKGFQSMNADEIYNFNQDKFKTVEKGVEKLYDEVYIEGNRIIAGVEIIDTPNQAKPFEFFKINRKNGLYLVTSYDSYLPQNIQIPKEPFISASQFTSVVPNGQQVIIGLNEIDKENFAQLLSKNQQEKITLIINNRIINVIPFESVTQNNVMVINSPWSEEKLIEFSNQIKNEN